MGFIERLPINDFFPNSIRVPLKCKNQHEIKKCPECGVILREIKPTLAGIKTLFKDSGYSDTEYEIVESCRHELIHSLLESKLTELQLKIKGILPKLEQILRYGILKILNIPGATSITDLSLLSKITIQIIVSV